MISGIEIKKTIIQTLKDKYKKKYKYLQNDVEEDYPTPSFFCAVISDVATPQTINLTRRFLDIKLKLYGCEHNEMIKITQELHELFSINLKVKDSLTDKYRFLLIQNKISEIEEYDKYMEFNFSLRFMDKTREIPVLEAFDGEVEFNLEGEK